jgi:membrane fusion protein (multidrug efflux system)
MSSATQSPLKIIRVAALVVAVGVGALACSSLLGHSNTESTNDAYVEADFTLVAPRVAGQISDVFVEGQSIRQSRAIAGAY